MTKPLQLVTRKFLFDELEPVTAPLYEIAVARNGVFKRARRSEITAVVPLEHFAAPVDGLANEHARVELVNKIPVRIFIEILQHARATTDSANFTENVYAVCTDETGGYTWQEISCQRAASSTIARSDAAAYRNAILEIHTHPPGCYDFSLQDDRDESGKFRLFGLLVDIHSPNPAIRLRVGVYDSFQEIAATSVTDALPETFVDLVKQDETTLSFFRQYAGGVEERHRLILTCAGMGAFDSENLF